jgi:hypothetical protein
MTDRMIPTSMISRIDRAIGPPSPARTRIRRLANRRKIQTRAASRAAANKESPTPTETNCSLRRAVLFSRVLPAPNQPSSTLPILRRTMPFGPGPQRR